MSLLVGAPMSRKDVKTALVGMGFTTPRVSNFSLRISGADGFTPALFLASG